MVHIPRRVHRRFARWLIVPIGLALPPPALALRESQEGRAVPELAATLTAGLEEAWQKITEVFAKDPRFTVVKSIRDIKMDWQDHGFFIRESPLAAEVETLLGNPQREYGVFGLSVGPVKSLIVMVGAHGYIDLSPAFDVLARYRAVPQTSTAPLYSFEVHNHPGEHHPLPSLPDFGAPPMRRSFILAQPKLFIEYGGPPVIGRPPTQFRMGAWYDNDPKEEPVSAEKFDADRLSWMGDITKGRFLAAIGRAGASRVILRDLEGRWVQWDRAVTLASFLERQGFTPPAAAESPAAGPSTRPPASLRTGLEEGPSVPALHPVLQMATALPPRGASIRPLAFNPRAKTMLIAGRRGLLRGSGIVRVWAFEAPSGQEAAIPEPLQRALTDRRWPVEQALFSPGGETIYLRAVSPKETDGPRWQRITSYDWETGTPQGGQADLRAPSGDWQSWLSVAVGPSGDTLYALYSPFPGLGDEIMGQAFIRVFDPRTGVQIGHDIQITHAQEGWPINLLPNPDGRRLHLFFNRSNEIRTYDLRASRWLDNSFAIEIPQRDGDDVALAVAPGGQTLYVGRIMAGLVAYDLGSGRAGQPLETHLFPTMLAHDAEGYLVVGMVRARFEQSALGIEIASSQPLNHTSTPTVASVTFDMESRAAGTLDVGRPTASGVDQGTSRPAGLEEDNLIFALARSPTPLTAEDVYAVNAWVTGQQAVTHELKRPQHWRIDTDQARRFWRKLHKAHIHSDQQLREVLRWLQSDAAHRATPADFPTITLQLSELQGAEVDLNEPLVVAAIAHWLLTPSRAEARYDATHRTAWLVMDILLARAGYPMIAYRPAGGKSDRYYRFDLQDDPRLFIQFVRRQVAQFQNAPYTLIAAPVTDLADTLQSRYRMLIRPPEGVQGPCESFTTTGPLRIVCEDEATRRAVQRLVEEAPATGAVPGLTPDAITVETQRVGMALNDPSNHTVFVRRSGGLVVSDSTPTLRQRLAIVTLTTEIRTLADVLRDALAQWAKRSPDSIHPFQRVILRGRRLDLYA